MPDWQSEHTDAPLPTEYEPAPHDAHAAELVAPGDDENMPAAHRPEQFAAEAAPAAPEYDPAGQGAHDALALAPWVEEKVPLGHARHTSAETASATME